VHLRGSNHSQVDERSAGADVNAVPYLRDPAAGGRGGLCPFFPQPASGSGSQVQEIWGAHIGCSLHQPSTRKARITLNDKQRTMEPIPEFFKWFISLLFKRPIIPNSLIFLNRPYSAFGYY